MSYSLAAKIFHWGVAALFAYGIVKQLDNVSQLRDGDLLRFELVFALVFLLILLMRFVYMRNYQQSALPSQTSEWQKRAAKFVHLSLYASLALIAISGIIIGLFFQAGWQTGVLMNAALGLHEISVSLSYWLIALHVAAAIFHRLKGDGVWSAMTPFWTEKSHNPK